MGACECVHVRVWESEKNKKSAEFNYNLCAFYSKHNCDGGLTVWGYFLRPQSAALQQKHSHRLHKFSIVAKLAAISCFWLSSSKQISQFLASTTHVVFVAG